MLNLKIILIGAFPKKSGHAVEAARRPPAPASVLPEILFGDHRLRDLNVPAIDLIDAGNLHVSRSR